MLAASVDTRNEQRDEYLRNGEILDAVTFPNITFESTSIVHTADNHFVVTGNLTVRRTTHALKVRLDYQGQAEDPFGNVRLGFDGSAVVSRTEFGLNSDPVLETGGVLVSDRVTLEFGISLIRI